MILKSSVKSHIKSYKKSYVKIYALFQVWVDNYLASGFSVWGLVLGSSGYALILLNGSKL